MPTSWHADHRLGRAVLIVFGSLPLDEEGQSVRRIYLLAGRGFNGGPVKLRGARAALDDRP